MTVQTFVNGLELVKSGMVHITENSELKITIDNLTLLFAFENDDSKQPVEKNLIDNSTLRICCNNFKNSLGEGIISPIEIGSLGGKKLYVSFFVWTPNISQGKRIFNYCLYLSE